MYPSVTVFIVYSCIHNTNKAECGKVYSCTRHTTHTWVLAPVLPYSAISTLTFLLFLFPGVLTHPTPHFCSFTSKVSHSQLPLVGSSVLSAATAFFPWLSATKVLPWAATITCIRARQQWLFSSLPQQEIYGIVLIQQKDRAVTWGTHSSFLDCGIDLLMQKSLQLRRVCRLHLKYRVVCIHWGLVLELPTNTKENV